MNSTTAIHHVEICVSNLELQTQRLVSTFGFRLIGRRSTPSCKQHVLRAGEEYFVVTERKRFQPVHEQDEDWTVFCCRNRDRHSIDSVFNVALVVKDVSAVTERAKSKGATVIRKARSTDEIKGTGKVTYSIISSCCGDVVHTLINKDGYSGWFLPGFEFLGMPPNATTSVWDRYANRSYIDHVTFACRSGESQDLMDWYSDVFAMKRFIFNKYDDGEDGMILDSPVWMRVKAMEYWLCSETALQTETITNGTTNGILQKHKPIGRKGPQFIVVVVESAFDKSSIHLEEYIRDHGGPGVQHIAFSTQNLFGTVSELAKQGVSFRRPPALYYQELDRISSINACGYTVDTLKLHGILLDTEADLENFESTKENKIRARHLMQIFTYGLFHRNTFFLEVIQRCGARGFGAGNISALARCIEEQQKHDMGKIKI